MLVCGVLDGSKHRQSSLHASLCRSVYPAGRRFSMEDLSCCTVHHTNTHACPSCAAVHPPPQTNAGRLLHHLAEVSGFKLSGVEVVVFDEADRMFEMGFAEQVCGCLHRRGQGRMCCTFVGVMLQVQGLASGVGLGFRVHTLGLTHTHTHR